jgi:hypothetical protein
MHEADPEGVRLNLVFRKDMHQQSDIATMTFEQTLLHYTGKSWVVRFPVNVPVQRDNMKVCRRRLSQDYVRDVELVGWGQQIRTPEDCRAADRAGERKSWNSRKADQLVDAKFCFCGG